MKKNIILSVFFLLQIMLSCVAYAQFHWHVVLRDTSDNKQYSYNAIASIDGRNIFAIGSVYDYSNYTHLLMRSKDSGNTWSNINLGLPPFNTFRGPQFHYLVAVDSTHLYAAGDSGYFASTSDAGDSWTFTERLTKDNLTGLSFCDTLHGIAVDQTSEIFTTSDGGKSWKRRRTFADVSFAGCKAFSGGKYFVADQYLGEVFRSTDYGNSWDTVMAYQTFVNGQYTSQITNIYFRDSLNGFLVGAKPYQINGNPNYFPIVVKTSDGGSTWKTVVDSSSRKIQDLFSASFLTEKTGIAVGRYYHDLMTKDGGNTWYEDTINLSIHDWFYLSQVIRLSATKVLSIASSRFSSNVIIGELNTNSVASSPVPNKTNLPFYPNPVTSDLFLEGTLDNIKKIVIYDILGRKLEEYSGPSFSYASINCNSFRSGMYWLEIIQWDGAKNVYKFIKE